MILLRISLPAGIDRWAERLVGLTLLVLGVYVLGTLMLRPDGAMPKSRYMLLRAGFHRARLVLARSSEAHTERYAAPNSFDGRSVFVIGIIHGLGAETPSQLTIFLLAANLGGAVLGLLGLATFLAGLLVMNALMIASAASVFGISRHRAQVLRVVSALTATYSLVMGALFLAGRSAVLPAVQ